MHFWANVRAISQHVGYTARGAGRVRAVTSDEMVKALRRMNLDTSHVVGADDELTALGDTLVAYFRHRADVLNDFVEPRLRNAEQARKEFNRLRRTLKPKCPIPMNKQKGPMKKPAYFTGIVNMLIETNCGEFVCDYDPQKLTTFTRDGVPLRTTSRRYDGAFPAIMDPIAVWEIKEYYYNKSFGSRVADGIYETLLDGMELEELHRNTPVQVKHYLMVDARAWWDRGRSYLCRIIDLLHMDYVDEVLFGAEVIERLPGIVGEWVILARARGNGGMA